MTPNDREHLHHVFLWTQRKKATTDYALYETFTKASQKEMREFKKTHLGQYNAYKKWLLTTNRMTLWSNANFFGGKR